VDVYVRSEYRYMWEVKSVDRILEEDLDISVFNIHYTQEGLSRGSGGNVAHQYPTEVEKYE